MKRNIVSSFVLLMVCVLVMPVYADKAAVTPFVMQLTRNGDNYGHRRAFMQIDKVLNDLGEKNLKIEVVAYEDGIHALLENNDETSQLLTKLANRGVTL